MNKYLNIFFRAKYDFYPPKKIDVLVYDFDSREITNKIFNLKRVSFLSTRKERFNLFVVIKTLFQFKFRYFDYLINFIKYVNPKLIITSIDNNKDFYRIKHFTPKITTIFLQNGHRTGHTDIFKIFEEKNYKNYKKYYHVDLMCVFNKMTADYYKKFISGKTFISGSVKNNCEKIYNKKNGLIFISLFRTSRIPFESENQLIKIIKKFCEQKKLKLKVLGKFKDTNRYLNEKIYFKDLLRKNYTFIKNSNERKTYKYLDNSEIVVSSGSTMGLESLGRKNKTAIVHALPKNPFKKSFWGYFTRRKDDGFFWSNNLSEKKWSSIKSEKKIFKVLNNLNDISKKKWLKMIRKYEYETCVYDYKNIKLKKAIKNICYQNNFNVSPFLR